MIRNLPLALDIFEASRRVWKHRRQQIVRPHALNLRRHFLAILKTQQRQRPVRIPAPARGKDRRIQRSLLENRLYRIRLQEMKHIAQRKTVLLGQRNVQSVVGGRRLQFKIEPYAKSFPKREPPSFVDPPAERRVNHQLHPPALIEETLRNYGR